MTTAQEHLLLEEQRPATTTPPSSCGLAGNVQLREVPSLSGLRAFASITVVLSHVVSPSLPGRYAVTLFFALSGFLITILLCREMTATGGLHAGRGPRLLDRPVAGDGDLRVAQGGAHAAARAEGVDEQRDVVALRLLEQQRSRLRQGEDEFTAWVIESRPIRLPGAAAIFTAATSGIPLALTHHLRHNRVLHECLLLVDGRDSVLCGQCNDAVAAAVKKWIGAYDEGAGMRPNDRCKGSREFALMAGAHDLDLLLKRLCGRLEVA